MSEKFRQMQIKNSFSYCYLILPRRFNHCICQITLAFSRVWLGFTNRFIHHSPEREVLCKSGPIYVPSSSGSLNWCYDRLWHKRAVQIAEIGGFLTTAVWCERPNSRHRPEAVKCPLSLKADNHPNHITGYNSCDDCPAATPLVGGPRYVWMAVRRICPRAREALACPRPHSKTRYLSSA
jgi:hypothetical protein